MQFLRTPVLKNVYERLFLPFAEVNTSKKAVNKILREKRWMIENSKRLSEHFTKASYI